MRIVLILLIAVLAGKLIVDIITGYEFITGAKKVGTTKFFEDVDAIENSKDDADTKRRKKAGLAIEIAVMAFLVLGLLALLILKSILQ